MLLEINRKLLARSSRVKAIDFHPTQPWILAGLYTGNVFIWNHETGALVKTFEVTEVPVRSVAFIARKNWFVCGSDDFHFRCYNYNTSERVAAFEAHPDYIRCLAVHPTQSLVLTGSDDMTIKLWDWEKGWKCVQTFEGHTHYIMNIAFNPKDSNTFASACLDRTVKVWSLGSPTANFTLDAHDKGVNYVEYYHGGDKPYIVTTGDDRLVKIWDYHSKSCIQTLEGHTSNVSFAIFHPSLPIIISGSEDGTVKIWNSSTYRLENTLNYGMERCWCIAYSTKGNDVGFGFDEGAVVVKLGKEEPSVSMDNSGKVVYARNSEIVTTNIQSAAGDGDEIADGQKIVSSVRDLGTTEIYAQSLQHSPNGRFVTVCGDGEYIIYTALAWRNKAFGSGLGFAWAADSNTYAVRDGVTGSRNPVKVFRNFKERAGLIKGISYATSGIWGGALLCVKGNGFICFYDWENGALVRRIEVDATNVSWSQSGTQVAVTSADSFYVLRFSRDEYVNFVDNGGDLGDEGVEDAFELVAEVSESVKTGKWVEECFVYTTSNNRLNYLVGSTTNTISHFDSQMYLLGYIPAHNRIYVCDKDVGIYAYSLSLSVIEYQTAVLRGDMSTADNLLSTIPMDQRNKIARFLELQDMKELALQVSTDNDQKFELALALDDLEQAISIAESSAVASASAAGGAGKGGSKTDAGNELKWRTLGDKALNLWKIDLAAKCFERAGDLAALLLLYSSTGDRRGMLSLAQRALEKGANNVAFAAMLQLNDTKECVDLLLKTDRIPEAALFARTYAPSEASRIVGAWKADLESKKRTKIAVGLADPAEDSELFENWEQALREEEEAISSAAAAAAGASTSSAPLSKQHQQAKEVDLIQVEEDNDEIDNDATAGMQRMTLSNGNNGYGYGNGDHQEQHDAFSSYGQSQHQQQYSSSTMVPPPPPALQSRQAQPNQQAPYAPSPSQTKTPSSAASTSTTMDEDTFEEAPEDEEDLLV